MKFTLSLLTLLAPLMAIAASIDPLESQVSQVEIDSLDARMELMESIMRNLDTSDLRMAREKRQSGCPNLAVYFWAGTGESGSGIVGRALDSALRSEYPGAEFNAVTYNTAAEYITSVRRAASDGASTISRRASSCPNTRFALSGYSKGALVVHRISLSSDVQSKVAAIAVFGDPALRSGGGSSFPINDNGCVFSYCNTGDIFCSRVPTSIGPHLAYSRDGSADEAASGIAGCVPAAEGDAGSGSGSGDDDCRWCWWRSD